MSNKFKVRTSSSNDYLIYMVTNKFNSKGYIGYTTKKRIEDAIIQKIHLAINKTNPYSMFDLDVLSTLKKIDYNYDFIYKAYSQFLLDTFPCTTPIDDINDIKIAYIYKYHTFTSGLNDTLNGIRYDELLILVQEIVDMYLHGMPIEKISNTIFKPERMIEIILKANNIDISNQPKLIDPPFKIVI